MIKPSGIDTPIAQHASNHLKSEALIPPPVYDPKLVADAILDAAVHARRSVTVGGFGRLQVVLGTHFPRALDALSPVLRAMMSDPRRRKTTENSLFHPNQAGQDRSGFQSGVKFSLYASAERHPIVLALCCFAAAGLAAAPLLGAVASGERV